MIYKIGTRVKKIAPPNLGYEAVIVGIGPFPAGRQSNGDFISIPAEVSIKYSKAWRNINGQVKSADKVCYTDFDRISPIIPEGHRPGIKDACEPLDKLLSEVRHEAVK